VRRDKLGGNKMSLREIIHILMLSPIYFQLSPEQRWELVLEYRHTMEAVLGATKAESA
jgi:hypothetical protein